MSTRPQTFRRSTTRRIAGWATIQWKKPERSQRDSARKGAEVHPGLRSLTRPS